MLLFVQKPASWAVVIGYPVIAIALILLTAIGLHRATRPVGDPPGYPRRLVREFLVVMAIWVAVIMGAAWRGLLARWDLTPPPFLLLPVAIVLLGVWIARSGIGHRLSSGLPLAALVGFQAFRLPLELLMHRTYAEGVMPEQMTYTGRNFDIVTGMTAAILGLVLIFRPVPRAVIVGWNILGLALLANIVAIAMLSTPRFQFFGPDRVNTFVAFPPYVLLPGIMVLAAWAGHLIIFRALRRSSVR